MQIFQNKAFHRWAQELGISDRKLQEAVDEIDQGLYEANLGGNVFKKRVSLEGRGKSAGARTIVAFKTDKGAFFVYGYAKNVRSNISEHEEIALKKLARLYFSYTEDQLARALSVGELMEVK